MLLWRHSVFELSLDFHLKALDLTELYLYIFFLSTPSFFKLGS